MRYYKYEDTYYQKSSTGEVYSVRVDENDIPVSGAGYPESVPDDAEEIPTLPGKVSREIDQVVRNA